MPRPLHLIGASVTGAGFALLYVTLLIAFPFVIPKSQVLDEPLNA